MSVIATTSSRALTQSAKILFKEQGPKALEALEQAGRVISNYVSPTSRECITRSFKAAQEQNSEKFRQLGQKIAEQSPF